MINHERCMQAYQRFKVVAPRYFDSHSNEQYLAFVRMFTSLYGSPADLFGCELALARVARYNSELETLATIRRRCRINSYVRSMIDSLIPYSQPYLVSLTFTDDVLASTSEDTRKKYVRDYLNANFMDYIACIDFGKSKGREHYHAIASLDHYDTEVVKVGRRGRLFVKIRDRPDWSYGYFTICPIYSFSRKTVGYALKSSNYAFKNSSSIHKVFHKRGVSHWMTLDDADSLLEGCSGEKLVSPGTERTCILDTTCTFYGKPTSYSKQYMIGVN